MTGYWLAEHQHGVIIDCRSMVVPGGHHYASSTVRIRFGI
jgi:hypothetical protein